MMADFKGQPGRDVYVVLINLNLVSTDSGIRLSSNLVLLLTGSLPGSGYSSPLCISYLLCKVEVIIGPA